MSPRLHSQPVENGAETLEESMAISLRRIADSLEKIASAWGRESHIRGAPESGTVRLTADDLHTLRGK